MNLNADITILRKLKYMGKVKTADIVSFTRELATLSEAGLPLIKSLTSLRDQLPEGKFRLVVAQVIDGIERGDSFSECLARHPKVFPQVYANMIRSGEVSGNLDEILKRLATLLEKQQRMMKRVRGALVYPAFVLGLALLILTLLMIFVIPTFTKIFSEMDSELPAATQFLISVSSILTNYWYLLIVAVFASGYLFRYLMTIPIVKYYVDVIILRLPVFGKLVSRVTISRITRTLGTLLNTQVPILNALKIVHDTTTNLVYANAIPRIMDAVKEGESFARMIEETKIFPNLVIKMVGVGEETGKLSEMLVKVADNYEEDVDILIASLSSLMEPILIVLMGLIVGFIVIAMFLPLFNLADML